MPKRCLNPYQARRMEQIFNVEGSKGWELVMINEERATFKRQLPPRI